MIRRRNPRLCKWQFLYGIVNNFSKEDYIGSFEKKFSDYLHIKYAISVNSGRTALKLILNQLNLSAGDEIIIPGYTLKDLVVMIENMKLKPVLVDVEQNSFNIDPNCIEKVITTKTKVIIATHLFGLPCNMPKIKKIAEKNKIFVIEDCAHACGADIDGKKVGTWGDAAFFSFEMIKMLNTFGGGMVVTNNEELYVKIKKDLIRFPIVKSIRLKVFAKLCENLIIQSPFYPILLYFFVNKFTQKILRNSYFFLNAKPTFDNLNFSNYQAYIGIKQLECLDSMNKKRAEIANKIVSKLNSKIEFQNSLFDKGRVFYFLVGLVNYDIEILRKKMFFQGVDAGIYDEITDNCYLLNNQLVKNVAGIVYNRNIQFPLYEKITQKEINLLIKRFNRAYES